MCFSKYIGHGLNKLLPTDAGGSIFISSCRLNYIEVSLRIACEVLVVAYACLCIHGLDIIMASQTETVCVVKAFVLSTPHLESRVQLHRISHMHAKCVHTHFPQYGWQFSDRSLLDLGSAESYIRTAGPLPRPGFQTNCIFFSFARFGSPSSRLGSRQDPSALVYGQKEAWLYTIWAIWCRIPGYSDKTAHSAAC
jgi:hypothetical protein